MVKIKLGEEEIFLDPKQLEFNETTIGVFMEKAAVWCDYFGQKLADADWYLQCAEAIYEVKYSEIFSTHKEDGCSDKLAEAKSKSNPHVEEAKKSIINTRRKKQQLQQHLRAWDKAHDAAKSRNYTLHQRKYN